MTLLELLVQELPKLGGWPGKANKLKFTTTRRIADDFDNEYFQFKNIDRLISSERVKFVTRDQYDEAVAAMKEQKMKYEYLKGSEKDFEGALEFFNIAVKTPDGNVKYCHELCMVLHPMEVIAERRPITEPSWDGVGLPPAGCEVEFKAEDGGWGAGTVLFVGEKRIFWRCHEDNMEYNCEISPPEFRPIRSEVDKKRYEFINYLHCDESLGMHRLFKSTAEALYNLIAAGKIPGVKLED